MFRRNFLFGKDGGTANLIDVGSEDLYQPGKGYGFVTEKNRREQKLLQIRELNSSFDTMYWDQNEQLSFLKEDENGCYLDSAEEVDYCKEPYEQEVDCAISNSLGFGGHNACILLQKYKEQ